MLTEKNLTGRHIALLSFIDRHNFVTASHIQEEFRIRRPTNTLEALQRLGLLEMCDVPYGLGFHYFWRTTSIGRGVIETK